MAHKVGPILISREAIAARVRTLGDELATAYAGREPVLVAIMKGCVLFLADLARAWPGPMDLEFVMAESYCGTTPREVRLSLAPDLGRRVRGRPALVVDDIFDTGRTLSAVSRAVRALGPTDLKTLVFLRKLRPRPEVPACLPDWVGFDIPDRFVVGYGLDYDGRYRNLPYVAAFDPAEDG